MASANSQQFPKTSRVVRSRDFTRALRRGSVAANDCLVAFAIRKDESCTSPRRIGITIPKKTGSAVVRNHWKRLIRESFRLHQADLPTGYDFVVRPKKDVSADWERIHQGFSKLLARAVRREQSSRNR
ncbi:ribonuclease P protein component [Rhodopirellula sp. JC740]|uniref:Ribonuclease P protein component n=1 Tax=Rhodopirellula halodulae TaxID=2894198 RepID=A0ABS8NMX1_9BACT|nr:ribonuclease P protein component [Rhodopirellula sp. JC740]MCC9644885.1 ribonuclease P protein component [Rhodopirellula sp. JC740]